MKIFKNSNSYFPIIFLLAVILLTYKLYEPGLLGGFLFDDFANLEELGAYGGVVNYESFKNFVFNGFSGPSGRPISLASFLLNDNTWPSDSRLFKPTNLYIHILTGLFLCWATLNIVRLFDFSEAEAIWIAIISSAIWLLHPYMISTTLYIVQRMAQLAAMFMFMGIAGYFYGRMLLNKNARSGYIWMSVSLCAGTLLAVLSKENGILLPLTILVIEACLPSSLIKLNKWWKLVFLVAPALLVLIVLMSKITFTADAWPERRFTQVERLLTEPRILIEYLYQLYIPRIEGRGLFQDGYIVSRGLWSPPATIFSILGLILIIGGAIRYRRLYPFVGIAILFFFASHLVESTVVNLELYFEHRNYAASAFLFLPIAAGIVYLNKKVDLYVVCFMVLAIFMLLSFLTWKRANLWSSSSQLELYWAVATPESPRARNRVGAYLLEQGRGDEAIKYMSDSMRELPKSSLLTINYILIKIYLNSAQERDFIEAGVRLQKQQFDAQAVKGFRSLVDKVTLPDADPMYATYALNLLDAINNNPNYNKFNMFNRLYFYLKGSLYLKLARMDESVQNYSIAMTKYADTDSALSMVADVANAGYFAEALVLLTQAESVYEKQPPSSLVRSKVVYDAEFSKMRTTLEAAAKSIQASSSKN